MPGSHGESRRFSSLLSGGRGICGPGSGLFCEFSAYREVEERLFRRRFPGHHTVVLRFETDPINCRSELFAGELGGAEGAPCSAYSSTARSMILLLPLDKRE